MEKIFVDTSALFALVNTAEKNHAIAQETWRDLIKQDAEFITNNYVAVESLALTQNRLGMSVVRKLQDATLALLQMVWIDEEQHEMAIQNFLSTNRRQLSLVDCASFETMRRLGIQSVFTFDEHFHEWGFDVIP